VLRLLEDGPPAGLAFVPPGPPAGGVKIEHSGCA